MLDSLKHVKTLESSGFSRKQAESQVQVLTHVIGGSMVTKEEFRNGMVEQGKDFELLMTRHKGEVKSDFDKFRQEIRSEFNDFKEEIRSEFNDFKEEIRSEFTDFKKDIEVALAKSELKMTIRLGVMMATMLGIVVAILK